MKWVMGMNESAETKGQCCHGKGISPMMRKNRAIWHSVRERMIKHNRERSYDEKSMILTWQIPRDREGPIQKRLERMTHHHMVQWWRDMVVWWHDQLVTMELVLSWYKMQHHAGLVIQSLLLPTTKNLPNNCFYLHSTMPMLNSCTLQSANGLNTITRPTPMRSGGDYPSGQQVAVYQVFLQFGGRLTWHGLDPQHGIYRPPFDPGVQDLRNGQLSLGTSPLQSWRVGEAQGTGTNQSTPAISLEDHQDGSNWSWGNRQGYERLY